ALVTAAGVTPPSGTKSAGAFAGRSICFHSSRRNSGGSPGGAACCANTRPAPSNRATTIACRTSTSSWRVYTARPALQTAARLYALKVLFDFAPAQTQHHRPAVRTDCRVGRPAQLVEDVGHLLRRQGIVRFHRRMARHRRRNLLDRLVDGGCVPGCLEVFSQRTQCGRTFFAPE